MIHFSLIIIAFVILIAWLIYEIASRFYTFQYVLPNKVKIPILFIVIIANIFTFYFPQIKQEWIKLVSPITILPNKIEFKDNGSWIRRSKHFEVINKSDQSLFAIWFKMRAHEKNFNYKLITCKPVEETYDLEVKRGRRIFSYDVYQVVLKDKKNFNNIYTFIHKLLPNEQKEFMLEVRKNNNDEFPLLSMEVLDFSKESSELVEFRDKLGRFVEGLEWTAPETGELEELRILSKPDDEEIIKGVKDAIKEEIRSGFEEVYARLQEGKNLSEEEIKHKADNKFEVLRRKNANFLLRKDYTKEGTLGTFFARGWSGLLGKKIFLIDFVGHLDKDRISLYITENNNLECRILTSDGRKETITVNIDDWRIEEKHSIFVTWNTEKDLVTLYLDKKPHEKVITNLDFSILGPVVFRSIDFEGEYPGNFKPFEEGTSIVEAAKKVGFEEYKE